MKNNNFSLFSFNCFPIGCERAKQATKGHIQKKEKKKGGHEGA